MLFGRRKQHHELQRQSSDESYSSIKSTSKSRSHRRMSSFTFGRRSDGRGGFDSDISVRSSTSTTNVTDPLNESWSSSGSGVLSLDMGSWEEQKIGRDFLDGQEVHGSSLELEIIRQLSFSPPREMKKRTDTAETAGTAASSSSASSSGTHEEYGVHVGLDLQHLEDLRRGSPSPLLGLQYLPDENIFI